MQREKRGKKSGGLVLRKHEQSTVEFLQEKGFNLKVIPPSNVTGVKTPDLLISGIPWEMKSITKSNTKTIERSFGHGLKQAPNLIYDLRNLKTDEAEQAVRILQWCIKKFHHAKQLMVITKDRQLLKLEK